MMRGLVIEVRTSATAVVGNPGLRRLAVALALAEVSAPVYFTASGVWAFREGGAMLAALLGVVALVPPALIAPLAAVVTDRSRRERVMTVSLVLRALLLAALAVGVAVDSTGLVLVSACGASMCARVFYPAVAASLPALAPSRQQLVRANAVVTGTEHVGSVVGPALAGAALVFVSPGAVCAAAAAGTLVAALTLARLALPAHGRPEADGDRGSRLRELTAGFSSLLGEARRRRLVVVHVVHCLAIGALGVALVQLALDDLAIGTPGLGLLEGAMGAGGVLGGLLALGRAANHTVEGAVRLAVLLWALPLLATVAFVSPAVALGGIAVAGIGNVLLDVAVYTHVQETADERVLARTVAALQSLAVAAVGAGCLGAGIMLTGPGTAATVLVVATCVPAAAAGLVLRRFGPVRVEGPEPAAAEPS
jgi:predicted MFS family arabinose efflux permease